MAGNSLVMHLMKRSFCSHPWIYLTAWVTVAGACYANAAPRKIYVMTDLEGASGVYKFTQTHETETPLSRQARGFFMGDVAAVVRGLRDGGATEIVVLDGHGNRALLPELMVPGAKYVTGLPRPERFPGQGIPGPAQQSLSRTSLLRVGERPRAEL